MQADFLLSSSAFRQAPAEVAAYARRQDYIGVEWYLDMLRLPIAPYARRRLFERMRGDGLGARFHAPAADVELGHRDPDIADASLRYLLMYIGFLAEVAPTLLTVHVGSRTIPMDLLSWERTLDHLRRATAAARERGITLCLENLKVGWTSDPGRLAAMAEAAGCAITFDLGHAAASAFVREGGALESFYAAVAPRVANVHVYAIETPEGRHLPLEDAAQHGPTLDALLAAGRRAWVLELSTREDLEQTWQALRAYGQGATPPGAARQELPDRRRT